MELCKECRKDWNGRHLGNPYPWNHCHCRKEEKDSYMTILDSFQKGALSMSPVPPSVPSWKEPPKCGLCSQMFTINHTVHIQTENTAGISSSATYHPTFCPKCGRRLIQVI